MVRSRSAIETVARNPLDYLPDDSGYVAQEKRDLALPDVVFGADPDTDRMPCSGYADRRKLCTRSSVMSSHGLDKIVLGKCAFVNAAFKCSPCSNRLPIGRDLASGHEFHDVAIGRAENIATGDGGQRLAPN